MSWSHIDQAGRYLARTGISIMAISKRLGQRALIWVAPNKLLPGGFFLTRHTNGLLSSRGL